MKKIAILSNTSDYILSLHNILSLIYKILYIDISNDFIFKIEEYNPCMILLDMKSKQGDSFQTLKILKNKTNIQAIPVICLSNLSDSIEEEKCFRFGAVDYIATPFHPQVVKARVENHINLYEYRKKFEILAKLDGLTNIPNRRFYNEYIEKIWEQSKSHRSLFIAAILDVDFFKNYNDTYGHLKGDDILKLVANSLQQTFEGTNIFLARYGGEEFSILFPNTTSLEALYYCETAKENIHRLAIPNPLASKPGNTLSVSIGISSVHPDDTSTLLDFMNHVDHCLYSAKNAGRNCIFTDFE